MSKSLYLKIAIAFVLVAFITAALVAVLMRITSATRLSQLVLDQQRDTLQTLLADYYKAYNTWENLPNDWREVQQVRGVGGMGMNRDEMGPVSGMHSGMEQRNLYGLADATGKVIIAVGTFDTVGEVLSARELRTGTDIMVNDERVGVLLSVNSLPGYNAAETAFLTRTNRALVFAMVGAVVVALLIGLLLARNLTKPLQALTDAAQNITRGNLDQQVEVTSRDEIGQLGTAFNSMSREVARVNQQRRQMTADIAHDLRTPLTVISGYIESMRDGVLAPTPERLDLIYSEIGRLQRMVADLRMLSQADAGELVLNPQMVEPAALLAHAAEVYQHSVSQQGVTLKVQLEESIPPLRLDEARMQQVLDNLVSNALRYTPSGGSIVLAACNRKGGVEISVSDTGSGIAAEDLPRIFDRFQRGDRSRHSEGNESGLGLAIVKALVKAHKGTIIAESTPGQGTTIRMWFPVG